MRRFLERRFRLFEHGTTIGTEVLAGATTFLTMAYIVFVQPAVLGAAGMDPGAVMVATCVSTAFATALMALLANYPIAVAPAMGHNFFFAYSVVIGMKVGWPIALGAVLLAGLLFVLTAGIGLRERVITAIPSSLKHAIAAGIGLLVAMIGLHTRSWAARGKPGAFAEDFMHRFHSALLARAMPRQEADMLRLSAGPAVLGYLYNLRRCGHVCAYQSGFAPDAADSHRKPGLVAHTLAMEQAADPRLLLGSQGQGEPGHDQAAETDQRHDRQA